LIVWVGEGEGLGGRGSCFECDVIGDTGFAARVF